MVHLIHLIHATHQDYALVVPVTGCDCPSCGSRVDGTYHENGTVHTICVLFPITAPKVLAYVCTACGKTSGMAALSPVSRSRIRDAAMRAAPLTAWAWANLLFQLVLLWTIWFLPGSPVFCGLAAWTTYGRLANGPRRALIQFSIVVAVGLQIAVLVRFAHLP